MLNEAQVAQYHEDGYVIPDFKVPEDMLAEIRMHHTRLVENRPEFIDYCPSVLAYDTAFLNYARIPDVLDMVGQVIGPDFALWNSSFFAKPAQTGRRTPWHQDGEYWPVRPLATCTVWMAIDAATVENGCLRVIKGSHKDRRLRPHDTYVGDDVTLNQQLRADEYDESQAVDLVLEAGQISLHDIYLLHGSEANTSVNPRRGMTLRYMPTSSVFDRDVAQQQAIDKGIRDHSDRTVYLMRGGDLSGKNDFRVRL
ncbi:MAG: ectoine hydroxylase-related dioxygenase (phytanoyl-CoA dioxygenase family) [Alphaproteobacteria bacterium]|jgi:ectoine hydroxylase-related dioxygenase (phytanoyl-CoA dioxygenase family)